MTTRELIEKLKEFDPSGEMIVAGIDSFASPNLFDHVTREVIPVARDVEKEVVLLF
jgi:hypothetical protein